MTPADEARFMRLWQDSASYRDIAQALQLKPGTVASRAATLVRQGKIQPRPRGGAYPKRRALARQDGTSAPSCSPSWIASTTTSAGTGADHCTAPYPKGKAVRWNLWISDAIRDEIAMLAAERGVSPSQLVQELLWKELRRG